MSPENLRDPQMEHRAETATWVIESLASALFILVTITGAGWIAAIYSDKPILLPLALIAGGIISSLMLYSSDPPPGS